jgi:2-oxoisovalerate dehydrogenase E1 component alpha subunit
MAGIISRRTLGRLALAVRANGISQTPAAGPTCHRRSSRALAQPPNSEYVSFPGALKSAFTTDLQFAAPETLPSLPTYRVVDQHGVVVDKSFKPDLSDAEVAKLYEDMLFISVLDPIMYEAQRQGRISFYLVSAGEEAVSVASASALTMEDVIYSQYREQGVFRQRGYTTADFMNQLAANKNDPGRGRNMPVHYGSKELNIVGISVEARVGSLQDC